MVVAQDPGFGACPRLGGTRGVCKEQEESYRLRAFRGELTYTRHNTSYSLFCMAKVQSVTDDGPCRPTCYRLTHHSRVMPPHLSPAAIPRRARICMSVVETGAKQPKPPRNAAIGRS